MHGTREIIQEAAALPVEERVIVIDSLLRSLNVPDEETDKQWSAVAQRRLAELRGGRVRAILGDQVFSRIKERFAR
ncbi:MAG: addiction module protein [Spirochaetia bacterium]|jgi:putative addiction module component (TIGR02574 family)